MEPIIKLLSKESIYYIHLPTPHNPPHPTQRLLISASS